MHDEAFRKELAQRKAEADRGDVATAIEKLLEEIPVDLRRSIVDNSREIAEADELLGLTNRLPPDRHDHSNNGSH